MSSRNQPVPQLISLRTHGASIRRAELQISAPIPIPREGSDGLGPQTIQGPPAFATIRRSQSATARTRRPHPDGLTSAHGAQNSISTPSSRDAGLQRRHGNAWKTVMRRIFTRARRSHGEEGEDGSGSSCVPMTQERMVAPNLSPENATFITVHDSLRIPASPRRPRPASTPDRSPSPSSAHRAPTVSEEFLPPVSGLRRRATLPSLVLSDDNDRSPIRSGSIQTKRRSRSASSLRECARRHRMSPIQWNRRSDEGAVWKTSVLDIDPRVESSTCPATSTSTLQLEKGNVTPTGVPPGPSGTGEPNDGANLIQESSIRDDAPFNVSNLMGSMQDTGLTLEQRVITLEVKLMDLELAISKMQAQEDEAPRHSSRGRPPSKGWPWVSRRPSVAARPSLIGNENATTPLRADSRPVSTDTMRPPTCSYRPALWPVSLSSPDINGISIEQYSALVMLIRREQSARKALEHQVAQLQEDLLRLQGTGRASIIPPNTPYPSSTPDSLERRYRRPRESFPYNDDRPPGETDMNSRYSSLYLNEPSSRRPITETSHSHYRNHNAGLI